MSPLLLLLSFSLFSSFLFAQKEIPAFGKVNKDSKTVPGLANDQFAFKKK